MSFPDAASAIVGILVAVIWIGNIFLAFKGAIEQTRGHWFLHILFGIFPPFEWFYYFLSQPHSAPPVRAAA